MLGQTWLRRFRPNSYIPTFVPISSTCPRPHPLRLSVRAETRGVCPVGPRCCRTGRNVGIPAPSSLPKPSIRPRETRIFVHSYVLTLTADRRRLPRSACTAAFYLFIRFGCRYRVYHYMNSVQFSLTGSWQRTTGHSWDSVGMYEFTRGKGRRTMAKKANTNLSPDISVIPEVIAEGKDEWGRRYFLFGVGGKPIPNLPPVLASRLDTKRQEVFGALTNAGYGLYTYATKNAFLESLQQWGKKAPSFKVVTKIGWNGLTYVLPDKIFNPRPSYSTRYRKAKASKGLTGSFGDRSWPRKAII
jgi:hypothetical protein